MNENPQMNPQTPVEPGKEYYADKERIIKMTSEGKISPHEGQLLLDQLEKTYGFKPCRFCNADNKAGVHACRSCGKLLQPQVQVVGPGHQAPPQTGPKKLYRSKKNRVFLGVCGGFGKHSDNDPTLVRVVFIFASLMTCALVGFIGYFILAAVVPLDPEE